MINFSIIGWIKDRGGKTKILNLMSSRLWHPGQAGEKNYVGPHDGRHVSTRALRAKLTGRIIPFVENSALRKLRLGKPPPALEQILPLVVSEERLQSWSTNNLPKLKSR